MTEGLEDSLVTMVDEKLARAPTFKLSPGLSVHWYEPGDENMWIAIHEVADKYNKVTRRLFFDQFPANGPSLHDRQCFLMDDRGQAIATGTAWAEARGRFAGYGRVHWIAVLPAYQGRGVGKMLMSLVCRRLLSLGHTRAFLTTDLRRPSAIRLYEKFGFTIDNIEERDE